MRLGGCRTPFRRRNICLRLHSSDPTSPPSHFLNSTTQASNIVAFPSGVPQKSFPSFQHVDIGCSRVSPNINSPFGSRSSHCIANPRPKARPSQHQTTHEYRLPKHILTSAPFSLTIMKSIERKSQQPGCQLPAQLKKHVFSCVLKIPYMRARGRANHILGNICMRCDVLDALRIRNPISSYRFQSSFTALLQCACSLVNALQSQPIPRPTIVA